MLPNGPLSGSVISVAIQSRDGGGWQLTGASLWVYGHGNHRTSVGCWWFSVQPLFHTNSLSVPSRPEHSRSWGVVFRRAPVDLPGIKVPVATCLLKMRLTVAWVRLTWAAIALCCISSRASANTPCLIPIWVGRHYYNNQWELGRNMQLSIQTCHSAKADLGNDHLSCSFGLQQSHLALKWKSGQGKVGFRWEAFTGTFHVNFSPLE